MRPTHHISHEAMASAGVSRLMRRSRASLLHEHASCAGETAPALLPYASKRKARTRGQNSTSFSLQECANGQGRERGAGHPVEDGEAGHGIIAPPAETAEPLPTCNTSLPRLRPSRPRFKAPRARDRKSVV